MPPVPRAGLDRQRVLTAAADLADEVGYENLSMSGLADRLGVAAPSLYKHIDGGDSLRSGLASLAVQDLGGALTDAVVGRSGRDAIISLAWAYRSFATKYPGRYAATVKAPGPSDGEHVKATEDVLKVVLAVLEGYGLRGDDAVDAARMFRSFLHGFASLEAAEGFGLPLDVDHSFERMLDGLDAALRELMRSSASALQL